jgi:hypothetical protein
MTIEEMRPANGAARLAIAIPAYGRAPAIASSVAGMADEARAERLDVVFYVSDDTPDASVEDALQPLIDTGVALRYRRNTPALRHDRNLIATLLWPDADYVWLLGSNYRVRSGYLGRAFGFLDKQDLLFVEEHAHDHRLIPALHGQEARALLCDRLWHQTMTGVTIYSRTVQSWVKARQNEVFIAPDFPQISVMMGFASDRDASIGWLGEPCLEAAVGSTPSYWQARAIDVFVDNWAAAVSGFPAIVPPEQRADVIRSHSARTNLFTTTKLMEMRRSGQFRWSSIRRRHFRAAMHLPRWKILAILALPMPILKAGSATLGWAKTLLPRRART